MQRLCPLNIWSGRWRVACEAILFRMPQPTGCVRMTHRLKFLHRPVDGLGLISGSDDAGAVVATAAHDRHAPPRGRSLWVLGLTRHELHRTNRLTTQREPLHANELVATSKSLNSHAQVRSLSRTPPHGEQPTPGSPQDQDRFAIAQLLSSARPTQRSRLPRASAASQSRSAMLSPAPGGVIQLIRQYISNNI